MKKGRKSAKLKSIKKNTFAVSLIYISRSYFLKNMPMNTEPDETLRTTFVISRKIMRGM